METNYLRTFVVVLESGSMSEAARRLDLTPAAVAQQMRVLERDLGVPLLRRQMTVLYTSSRLPRASNI